MIRSNREIGEIDEEEFRVSLLRSTFGSQNRSMSQNGPAIGENALFAQLGTILPRHFSTAPGFATESSNHERYATGPGDYNSASSDSNLYRRGGVNSVDSRPGDAAVLGHYDTGSPSSIPATLLPTPTHLSALSRLPVQVLRRIDFFLNDAKDVVFTELYDEINERSYFGFQGKCKAPVLLRICSQWRNSAGQFYHLLTAGSQTQCYNLRYLTGYALAKWINIERDRFCIFSNPLLGTSNLEPVWRVLLADDFYMLRNNSHWAFEQTLIWGPLSYITLPIENAEDLQDTEDSYDMNEERCMVALYSSSNIKSITSIEEDWEYTNAAGPHLQIQDFTNFEDKDTYGNPAGEAIPYMEREIEMRVSRSDIVVRMARAHVKEDIDFREDIDATWVEGLVMRERVEDFEDTGYAGDAEDTDREILDTDDEDE